MENFNAIVNGAILHTDLVQDGGTNILRSGSFLPAGLTDLEKAAAERQLPDFEKMEQDNVHLVDTKGLGIDFITEKGIVSQGQDYEVDCIIYATGFELSRDWSHRANLEVYGRGGQIITDCWKDGASTFHGWVTRGFPNCCWVSITQAALTPTFLHVNGEQANHIAYVVKECMKRNIKTVGPTKEAEEGWVATIVMFVGLRKGFLQECPPGYFNNGGNGRG